MITPQKSSFIKNFGTALGLVYKTTPGYTIANFVITFIQSIFPLIIIYLIKELVDAVQIAVMAEDKAKAFNRVTAVVLLSGGVYLVNSMANALSQYIREYQSQHFSDAMYNKLHVKASQLDLSFYENAQYHDMFYRALQEAPYRPVKIVNSLFYIMQSFLAICILSALLISLHWSIALVLIIATVPVGYIRMKYALNMYKWQKENTQRERKSYYFSRILTNEIFAKELRLFGLKKYFSRAFKITRAKLIKERLQIIKNKTYKELPTQILATLAIFSAYGFMAHGAVYGTLSLGALVMYFMALQKGMGFFKEFLNSLSALYEDNLYIENLMAFLKLENSMTYSGKKGRFPDNLKKGITLRNVSFKYPNSQRHALKEINMHIKPQTTVAIVGDNGAGKTTLVKLLCHLYQADSGEILIDDTPLNQINDEDIKSHISVLFQDFVLYHLSAKDNIMFGRVDRPLDAEQIKEAAQKAGIDKTIEHLPQQYDTILGKLFDGCEELSIGEWQKMALARAFYKNSPVIILDEPTSALDPKAEYEVFRKFKEIIRDKTAIIVSHRFSTVKMADYIYVMEKETIIEEGTHAQLMQLNGKYASMYRMQSEAYNSLHNKDDRQ